MGNHETCLRPTGGVPQTKYDIIQARFQNLKEIQTRQPTTIIRNLIIPTELALENTIHTAGALFGAQLAQII
jgi:hypothetical protein